MQPADAYDNQGFWRASTIASGIMLLLILLAGVIVIWIKISGGGNPRTATPPSQVTTSPGTSPPGKQTTTTTGTKNCNLPAGDQTVPQVTPPGITWQIYQTVALPFSKQDGPEYINGDIARCYAHNPIGALVAASQIGTRYLIAPDWKDVVNEQVFNNPGRAVFIANRSQVSNPGGNQPGDYNQLAAFKFVDYTPSEAVIEFVTQSQQGALQSTTTTVQWVNGDWQLVLQPDGGTSPNALPVTSILGFSQWAGV